MTGDAAEDAPLRSLERPKLRLRRVLFQRTCQDRDARRIAAQ
jgi:hypothetical protein